MLRSFEGVNSVDSSISEACVAIDHDRNLPMAASTTTCAKECEW
jgi:hypothetical protein